VIAPASATDELQGPEPVERRYELTLYVFGASELSSRAITYAKQLCDLHLAYPAHLAVVDVHDDASGHEDIIATPTLVKTLPLPLRRHVGDISDIPRVLSALGLAAADPPSAAR
jgi:circadian clock protein KaiB